MNQEILAENMQKINKRSSLQTWLLVMVLILLFLIIGLGIYYFVFYSNPQRILSKTVKNMATIENLHFTKIASETKTNGEISKISGDIVFLDKLKINLIPGLKDMETVIIGGKVYTKWSDNWLLIANKKPEEFNIDNPQKFIDLLNSVSSVKSLGIEKIGDQDMNHLGYTIDEKEAKKTFSSTDTTSYLGEIWIGESDGLIHRIAITFIPENTDDLPAQAGAPRKYQMDFSNFNGNITIEEPKI